MKIESKEFWWCRESYCENCEKALNMLESFPEEVDKLIIRQDLNNLRQLHFDVIGKNIDDIEHREEKEMIRRAAQADQNKSIT